MAQQARFIITTSTENTSTPKIYQVKLLIITIPKKKTEGRIQIPCLDKKRIDGKRICNCRQALERLKPNTKRKYNRDIGPLIIEGTIIDNTKDTEEKYN